MTLLHHILLKVIVFLCFKLLFIIGDWNAKVESQETPGVTENLALEYGMKQGKQ